MQPRPEGNILTGKLLSKGLAIRLWEEGKGADLILTVKDGIAQFFQSQDAGLGLSLFSVQDGIQPLFSYIGDACPQPSDSRHI